MALAWACSEARAQPTYVAAGVPKNKPAGVNSFVVTSAGTTVWDYQYAQDLRAFPGSIVDVVMQQCFSGGFAPNMQASLGGVKNYTFTAAAHWNESALNDVSHALLGFGPLNSLDNFTRAWVDSFPRNVGLYQHYTDATSGNAAAGITQDPFAPGGRLNGRLSFENPVFASPDPTLNSVANNGRDIITNNTYAIIVGWSPPLQDRHDANIDRVYEALQGINIRFQNIVVLDGNKDAGTRTDAFPALGLNSHFIDGKITLANWTNALAGNLFTGKAPTESSRLLVYNTGHGGSWDANAGTDTVERNSLVGLIRGYFNTNNYQSDAATGIVGTSDAGGLVTLQISTRTPLPAGVTVSVDGDKPMAVTTPTQVIDLSTMIGSSYTYDVQFPMSDLSSSPLGSPISVELDNLSNPSTSLVSAFTLEGGDQIFAAGVSPVAEPSTLILAGIACTILAARHFVRQRA
jgi:hypothetical protein